MSAIIWGPLHQPPKLLAVLPTLAPGTENTRERLAANLLERPFSEAREGG